MKKIHAVPINAENFGQYGKVVFNEFEGLINMNNFYIGRVTTSFGSFYTKKMERHLMTKEIFLCREKPMIITVADSDVYQRPKSEYVKSFVVQPNQIIILNEGIWHDVNHGVDEGGEYYYLAMDVSGIWERRRFKMDPEPVLTVVEKEN